MCDQCASGLSPEQYNDKLRNDILDSGFKVVTVQVNIPDVEPDYPAYNFTYSVGRTLYGKPELFVCGAIPDVVQQFMLNEAAAHDENLADGYIYVAGTLLDTYEVNVVEIDPEAARMFKAIELFGNFQAFQLVWPDMNGIFPGDAGYEYADTLPEVQPIYTKARP